MFPGQLSILSPVQKVDFDFPFNLMVKRDDLIHPQVSGNKYRKLQGILAFIFENKLSGIITFGGPFSNHIYATAAAASLYELQSIGIIRGEDDPCNPTLIFARSKGMQLFFVSRADYKLKIDSSVIKKIIDSHPNFVVVNEGGEHDLAFSGLEKVITEIINTASTPDYLAVAAGTGTTAIGLLKAIKKYQINTKLLVFPALNHAGLYETILHTSEVDKNSVEYVDKYVLGGYARVNRDLIEFINRFYKKTSIPLDPVYNGKLVYGLYALGQENYFDQAHRVTWLHTGGIQGCMSYNYVTAKKTTTKELLIDL